MPPTPIQIVGVNRRTTRLDDYNGQGAFCDGRDLPFLEEEEDGTVWQRWGIRYRDVVVLDENNEVVEVYNLTDNSLSLFENQQAFETILLEAAGAEPGTGGAGGAGGSGGSGGAGGAGGN